MLRSRPVPGMQIEILNWAVQVSTAEPDVPRLPDAPPPRPCTTSETRPITCDIDGRPRQAALVARDSLTPGDTIAGPALITEPQTTTLVSADFTARVDAIGNLILIRNTKGAAR